MLRIGLLLLVLPMLVLMGVYFVELFAVNDCVAEGGSWNYLDGRCDFDARHPFIPLPVRKPLLINGGMLLCCVGLLLTVIGLYRRRH